MTNERWRELMFLDVETQWVNSPQLTTEEEEAGWHFCPDWDDLLIGPTMPEWECCTCRS